MFSKIQYMNIPVLYYIKHNDNGKTYCIIYNGGQKTMYNIQRWPQRMHVKYNIE